MTRKYSARRPSSANALAAKTMKASSVTPKTAGIESSANSRSVRADRDQHDEQRRDESPALVADGQRAAVVVVGDREALAGELHHRVVLDLRLLVAVAEELDRREQQDQPEDQEHEREQLEQRGAEQDEDHAQDQRQHDPDDQDLLLVLVGHRERAHDDHEHEQVVDRQALLDDVAGEVLAAELPARDRSRRRRRSRSRPRCRRPTTASPRGSPTWCGRSIACARSIVNSTTTRPTVAAQPAKVTSSMRRVNSR